MKKSPVRIEILTLSISFVLRVSNFHFTERKNFWDVLIYADYSHMNCKSLIPEILYNTVFLKKKIGRIKNTAFTPKSRPNNKIFLNKFIHIIQITSPPYRNRAKLIPAIKLQFRDQVRLSDSNFNLVSN